MSSETAVVDGVGGAVVVVTSGARVVGGGAVLDAEETGLVVPGGRTLLPPQAPTISTRAATAVRRIDPEFDLAGNLPGSIRVESAVATITLTKDNFSEIIEGSDTVIVDFWAAWCGPCRSFAPTFESAAERNPDLVFGKVDTEAEQELAGYFGIRSIPTLMVFREKVILYSQAGALPAPSLDELITKIREVDMEDVHRQIAEQQATQA